MAGAFSLSLDRGGTPPRNEKNGCRNRAKTYTTSDVRLLQSRPWEWDTAVAEEELARRLSECDGWPVMVPEAEGQAWIEIPACDASTEWITDVFRTYMIEAARQREVALGFVSDLLATVAMQNGHIEAMAKHTNRITKHNDREANKFQRLKEQFTQNVEDLKRAESERDRLRQENQDLRESLEVKRESSPRGGGSDKSAKIPDPERLGTGVSPKYKAWKGDMVAKLTINEDWYVTDAALVPYCLSRLTGQARDHVEATRGCDGNAAFGSYTDIFAVLDQIYIDPDEKNTAREKLRDFQLTNEGFAAFRL
ncbi:hypothetical protein E4U58_001024 [Claviceps cyperi]|nr:hypothetical protein E4U58_001024 [Claviceps cyperi]